MSKLVQKLKLNGETATVRVMEAPVSLENQYANLLRKLLEKSRQFPQGRDTRSGKVHGLWDEDLVCDLGAGEAPFLYGKSLPLKSVIGELCSFLHGHTNAADFRNFGTNIWNANANQTPSWLENPARKGEDDLGRIYGAQWTDWPQTSPAATPRNVNQINEIIRTLTTQPKERAHLVSAWNVGELHLMALKPCHVMFQCYVCDEGRLHLKMYQRSADWFLGVPFNLASYGLLLLWLSQRVGRQPGKLKITFGDLHLYDNHKVQAQKYLDQLEELRLRSSKQGRGLDCPVWVAISDCTGMPTPDDFCVSGYDPAPAIPAPMAP